MTQKRVQDGPDVEAGGNGSASGPEVEEHIGRLQEAMRAKRQAIAETTEITLNLPGYDDPELLVQHRKMEWDDVAKIARRAEKSKNPQAELLSQCDLIAQSCEMILIREKGKTYPLHEALNEDEPIMFDNRLAEFLGFQGGNGRQVVRGTFNNDLAIGSYHVELFEFMRTSNQQDDEDFSDAS